MPGKKLKVDLVSIKTLYIDYQGDADYAKKEDGTLALKKTTLCPHIKSPLIASDGDVYICCIDIFGK